MTYKYMQLEATTSKKVATGRYLFREDDFYYEGVPFSRFVLLNPETLKTVYTSSPYQGRYVSRLSDKEFLVETLGGTRHRIRLE